MFKDNYTLFKVIQKIIRYGSINKVKNKLIYVFTVNKIDGIIILKNKSEINSNCVLFNWDHLKLTIKK